jgi:hypothetical protein
MGRTLGPLIVTAGIGHRGVGHPGGPATSATYVARQRMRPNGANTFQWSPLGQRCYRLRCQVEACLFAESQR